MGVLRRIFKPNHFVPVVRILSTSILLVTALFAWPGCKSDDAPSDTGGSVPVDAVPSLEIAEALFTNMFEYLNSQDVNAYRSTLYDWCREGSTELLYGATIDEEIDAYSELTLGTTLELVEVTNIRKSQDFNGFWYWVDIRGRAIGGVWDGVDFTIYAAELADRSDRWHVMDCRFSDAVVNALFQSKPDTMIISLLDNYVRTVVDIESTALYRLYQQFDESCRPPFEDMSKIVTLGGRSRDEAYIFFDDVSVVTTGDKVIVTVSAKGGPFGSTVSSKQFTLGYRDGLRVVDCSILEWLSS